MGESVKFLRHNAVMALRQNIGNHARYYERADADFADCIKDGDIQATRGLDISPELANAIKAPRKGEDIDRHDAFNSALVYKSVRLNPAQACDERIWAYLSHFDLRHYVAKRWPLPDDKKVQHISAHYFVVGQRGLLRDNAIARLWWMGHIAARSSKFSNPEKALDILLFRSDVRANLLERSLGMNPEIFDAVVCRLQQDYTAAKKLAAEKKSVKNTIFDRSRFRNLMKDLNRIGGYRMLDALDFGQLQEEIRQIAG